MDFEREESNSSLGDITNISPSSKLTSTSNLSSIARLSIEKNVISEMNGNISHDTDMDAILHLWVNMFKKKPDNATLKLFTLALNCFEIDVNDIDMGIIKFDAVSMYREMFKCFKSKEKNGLLLSPLVVKKSPDVQKMLTFFSLIFRHHNNLFFANDSNKSYFIFLRDIFMKLSKCNFVGPRLLGTSFGLKIFTGLIQSNLDTKRYDLNILLKEFFIKRWNDTNCIIRETVLLELKLWIQIDSSFIQDYWLYIYRSFGDQSTSVQTIALKMSENILNIHNDIPNLKLFIKTMTNVLPNLLLSKNEEVVISAFNLYSILRSKEDDEEYMENIEPIALELIFSEKSNIAQLAAKHFVNEIVISNSVLSEQMKVLLKLLQGIPPYMKSIASSFYVDAIYDLCPLLTNFKLISQMLAVENYIEETDKYNLMTLLMYIVKWLMTGIKPEHKTTNLGDTNDVIELHINILKKKEFTAYMSIHLLNQLRECKEPTHAFSLWVLLQYCDYKLLQDKMIIPEIINCVILFYNTWNIPTILEMISKCINIITSNIEGREQSLCLKCIKDIALSNINILIDGIENSSENTPGIMHQKDALIKIWSLAKYNYIPDELEPLKYLSYYVPNLNDIKDNLIVSEYALEAYMEILKKKLVNSPIDSHNSSDYQHSFVSTIEIRDKFLDVMFIILSKCDSPIFSICETAFLIVNKLLRLNSNTKETDYVLHSKHNMMLTDFMYYVCQNCEDNDDSNTLKLIEIYVKLIQDGILDMNHLIVLLQFIKMDIFERALQPIFNFFCKKETGCELSNVINVFLVYMFENIISQKSDFQNSSIKDTIDVATTITRLLCKCVDQVGKRLVSTNIHRHGIQYAMSDTYDYPFLQFFWVLVPMCESLIPYDAQRLCDYFLKKPAVGELINAENVLILNYLYKLQEICNKEKS